MLDPNGRQVGGVHYKSQYQHWDWATDISLGYLEGAATKYISRWREKNGVQDVEKAIHYLEKAKACFLDGRHQNLSKMVSQNQKDVMEALDKTDEFFLANNFGSAEMSFMVTVAGWQDGGDLSIAIGKGIEILADAQKAARAAQGAAAATPSQAPASPHSTPASGGAGLRPAHRQHGPGKALGMRHPFGFDGED